MWWKCLWSSHERLQTMHLSIVFHPNWPTHLTWCVTVHSLFHQNESVSLQLLFIIYFIIVRFFSSRYCWSRVIWQCVTPLLELLAWPSCLACHQVGSSWLILWRVKPLFQCFWLNMLLWWIVRHIRTIFIIRDKSLEQQQKKKLFSLLA